MAKPLHLGFLYAPQSGHQTHDESFDPLNPGHLTTLAQDLESAGFTFLLIDDSVGDADPARSEAFTTASFLATRTRHIGLIAAANTSYVEPYNVTRLAASLDHVTHGRAGWLVSTGAVDPASANYGQSDTTSEAHYERADEILGIARRLWDSWEDDAFVRDKQSGVFVDGTKIHPIEHEGPSFRVKGPLNVARPPQGQVILAHRVVDKQSAVFAGRHADIVILGAEAADNVVTLRDDVFSAAKSAQLDRRQLLVFAEVVPFLQGNLVTGKARVPVTNYVAGSPQEIVDQIEALANALDLDGLVLAPRVLRIGLDAFSRHVVPELARRQRLATGKESATLRERLGLTRPRNIFEQPARRPAA
ncbi:LLM class flavin-dependent oxidoreductase [Bradyrhizobium sp. SSUT18]|uniref:LLM class flavin-dependent oxidoreductase n=1 Tax=Bradyrhizobium sp. SSUT18 TaxID=3040602 RepID=UPI00244AECE8|nr:LLM class flavin-dependent oxidoreductase [Bradyrhizobium sp. SSUT18]MDH2399926.1 LLM class flavin-dependent oxidoreductase [Bradyrhizobium sp. SSUT18]